MQQPQEAQETSKSTEDQRRTTRAERRQRRRAAQVSPFKANRFWVEWAPAQELKCSKDATDSKFEFICQAQATTKTCTTSGLVIEDDFDSDTEAIMTCSDCGCRVFRGRFHEE